MATTVTFQGDAETENDCRAISPIDGAFYSGEKPAYQIPLYHQLVFDKRIAETYGKTCGPDCDGDCFARAFVDRHPDWFTAVHVDDTPACPTPAPDAPAEPDAPAPTDPTSVDDTTPSPPEAVTAQSAEE